MARIYLAIVLVLAVVSGAAAQDFGPVEIRGGIMAHSVDEPGPGGLIFNATRIQDANVELLFAPLDGLSWLGAPQPMIGATVNFGGLESMAYAGLTWHAQLFDTPVFIEGALGGAISNGTLHGAIYPARSIGCPTMFYQAVSLGYDISKNANISLFYQHASHAGLCGPDNRGLSNLGVRFGFRF